MEDIILENSQFRLTVGGNAVVKSLIHKATGEECLDLHEPTALFSVTQDRPYHNEIKLSHLCKETTFQANRITREGNRLIVGFELVPYTAIVEIQVKPAYIAFTLVDFEVDVAEYNGHKMDLPPVKEFRLLQLPVKNRENFGDWLNVMWDENVAVNVLASSPHTLIDTVRYQNYRIFYADALREVKLQGCTALLLVSDSHSFLDKVEIVEQDFDMPKGVESRRCKEIGYSIYRTAKVTPETVDEHIRYAKLGGFRMMLIFIPAIFQSPDYSTFGNYIYRPEYPEGAKSLKEMLDKIKAAGIIPGLHFLHTHIGLKSKYVTPVADHRLNLKQRFNLAKDLLETDDTVFVCQNPAGCTRTEDARILQFGGELISYEDYTTEPPYAFTGCKRGAWDTVATPHTLGTWGGILDVSEYFAISAYLDQNTDLQDEIADILAETYACGFEFVYFDGSEGTNQPFEFHIPNAQLRVYQKLNPKPLFAEGAARSHFSWHILSGGNAFDVFPMSEFKMRIAQYPAEEASRMRKDFTRVNFGWWGFRPDTQPDHFEYGASRAAAWDCPYTMIGNLEKFGLSARTEDTLEALRRWEDVRISGWLTDEQKTKLKDTRQEHILLINEQGEYELVAYDAVETTDARIRAFTFCRKEKSYAVLWHTEGAGTMQLDGAPEDLCYEKELGGENLLVARHEELVQLPLSGRSYLSTDRDIDCLRKLLQNAKLIEK